MVTRLVKLRLLERVCSETDSRAWCLRLTSAGQAALKISRASFASVNARIESELSQQDIKQLADHLDRLSAAFGD